MNDLLFLIEPNGIGICNFINFINLVKFALTPGPNIKGGLIIVNLVFEFLHNSLIEFSASNLLHE